LEEREKVAKSKGVCPKCGRVTHKVTPFRSIPLDGEFVEAGVCLVCAQGRGGHGFRSTTSQREANVAIPANLAPGGKAAKLLGAGEMSNASLVSTGRLRRSTNSGEPPPVAAGSKAAQLLGEGKRAARRMKTLRRSRHDSEQDSEQDPPAAAGSKEAQILGGGDGSARGIAAISQGKKAARTIKRRFRSSENDATQDEEIGPDSQSDVTRRQPTLNRSAPAFRSVMPASERSPMERKESDAWDIVKQMRSNPDDLQLLIKKCDALRNIGTNVAGSLYEIIDVMRRFTTEDQLQKACIGALWSLSSDGSWDEKTEIIDAGGAELIVDALTNFPLNASLLCWGLGALSNLGEGIGNRMILEEEGVVEAVEDVLKTFHDAKCETDVFYWAFRCLVTLICEYDDVPGRSSSRSHAIDLEEEAEDFNASRKSREEIENSEIIDLTLRAIQSMPMNGTTLEMAFKFMSHFDIANYVPEDDEDFLLMRACEKAIFARPRHSFPVLHHLACAIVCLAIKIDAYDREEWSMESNFAREALDVLTRDRQRSEDSDRRFSSSDNVELDSLSSATGNPPPNTHDVMICTLSHLLCFGNVTLGYAESNDLLKICCAVLESEESSAYLQGSCCWIVWSMFAQAEDLGVRYAMKAAKAVQGILPKIDHDPGLISVAFSALSNAADSVRLEPKALVATVACLATKYSDSRMLRREACRLMCKICKTKEVARIIASSGWLQLANKPLDNSKVDGDLTGDPLTMTAHLMIKLSVRLADDDDALSINDQEAMIKASNRLKAVSPLAAKSWLGFLAVSITPSKWAMAIKSVKEILEAFPKNIDMQKLALAALRNVAVSIQKAGHAMDVSACIRPVLDAHKEHGAEISEECCSALWALTGVECELDPALVREVVHFAIEVTEMHTLSSQLRFGERTVSAGMAIFANSFSNPGSVMRVVGEKIVNIVVEVVNTTIYACLDKRRNHPEIFHLAFRTLRRLCTDDSCRSIIVNHGGIVAVVDGMMNNLESACIQENGCNVLRQLAGSDLEMKLKIVEADGVDVIMNVMISHGEDANVLSEAFQALSSLSVDRVSRNFIAQQGGIMMVAGSLSALADSVELQKTGLAALCNLASDIDEGILEMSNIYAVVNGSLERHAGNAAIQVKGLALLYNLSIRSEGMANQVISSGSLKNITKALENHADNAKVVSSALRMLISLSDAEESRKALREEGLVTLIVRAITLNVQDLKLAIAGCNILDLITSEESAAGDVDIGLAGVETVEFMMMVHHSSECIQSLGCRMLPRSSSRSFASDAGTPDEGPSVVVRKMTEVLLSAMSGFPRNYRVQKNAAAALRNVSGSEENAPALIAERSRTEAALARAAERFPECEPDREEVLKALAGR